MFRSLPYKWHKWGWGWVGTDRGSTGSLGLPGHRIFQFLRKTCSQDSRSDKMCNPDARVAHKFEWLGSKFSPTWNCKLKPRQGRRVAGRLATEKLKIFGPHFGFLVVKLEIKFQCGIYYRICMPPFKSKYHVNHRGRRMAVVGYFIFYCSFPTTLENLPDSGGSFLDEEKWSLTPSGVTTVPTTISLPGFLTFSSLNSRAEIPQLEYQLYSELRAL